MEDSAGRLCIEAKTTVDLEQTLGMTAGNIFHGALSWPFAEDDEPLDTPARRWGVATAHDRILLCGSGSRRGGAVSGIGGHNAAMAVLGELGHLPRPTPCGPRSRARSPSRGSGPEVPGTPLRRLVLEPAATRSRSTDISPRFPLAICCGCSKPLQLDGGFVIVAARNQRLYQEHQREVDVGIVAPRRSSLPLESRHCSIATSSRPCSADSRAR